MKSRKILTACAILLALFFSVTGSMLSLDNSQRATKKTISEFSKEDFIKMAPKRKIDRYEQQKLINSYVQSPYYKPGDFQKPAPKLLSQTLPTDIRTPAEFERSQSVLITWPEYPYDSSGNYFDEAFTPGIGYYYDQFYNIHFGKIAGYYLDLFTNSPYPAIWLEMIKAIQPEAQVWIRVVAGKDTTSLKSWFAFKGVQLYNYRFFVDTDGQNAFWSRDFGPFGVYYGQDDSLMFINAMYYPMRAIDNDFSDRLGAQLGYSVYDSKLETEGGNFITDGHGNIFFSSVIYENNMDTLGRALAYKKPMTTVEVNQEITDIFGAKKLNMLPMLYCDGGTGHVDMYLKMTNDKNFIVMNYPGKYNTQQFPDYATANKNYTTIKSLESNDGSNYTLDTLPFPLNDKLQLPDAICDSVYIDARTYANGLTVNNTYIVPIYSDPYTGLRQQDKDAINMLKRYMPGYTIYPIDSRALTTGGGAIHCVTMQIPEDNPVVVNHTPVSGLQKTEDNLNFTVNAYNHSGIESMSIEFKKAGDIAWTKHLMETVDSKTFTYIITAGTYNSTDEIEYHIIGKTNNGKEFRRPSTNSNYDFYYTLPAGVEDDPSPLTGEIASIIPNPASESAIFRIVSAGDNKASLMIYNSLGGLVLSSGNVSLKFGINDLTFGLSDLSNGAYRVVLNIDGKISSKELVIVK